MKRRTAHTVRDVPGRPDLVQIDVRRDQWATILRSDLEAVEAEGLWSGSYRPKGQRCPGPCSVRVNRPRQNIDGKVYRPQLNLAAFILELHGLPRPTEGDWQPDHRNFDVLDNRPVNLRWLPEAVNRTRHRRAA